MEPSYPMRGYPRQTREGSRALPVFKGYTVDGRIEQFRKFEPGKLEEFIEFDSEEGKKLLLEIDKMAEYDQKVNFLRLEIWTFTGIGDWFIFDWGPPVGSLGTSKKLVEKELLKQIPKFGTQVSMETLENGEGMKDWVVYTKFFSSLLFSEWLVLEGEPFKNAENEDDFRFFGVFNAPFHGNTFCFFTLSEIRGGIDGARCDLVTKP